MFDSEDKLQKLVHENPEIILSGIPEIDPQYCPDTPSIVSLGREIPLASGPVDNLYLDTCTSLSFKGLVERLCQDAGAEKVVFGSDMVFLSLPQQIGKILFAGITDDEKRLVLAENAKRIFCL